MIQLQWVSWHPSIQDAGIAIPYFFCAMCHLRAGVHARGRIRPHDLKEEFVDPEVQAWAGRQLAQIQEDAPGVEIDPLIAFGKTAKFGQFPYMASLQYVYFLSLFCAQAPACRLDRFNITLHINLYSNILATKAIIRKSLIYTTLSLSLSLSLTHSHTQKRT